MVTTRLYLGDECSNCGATAQHHLQNPFGIRYEVKTWSKPRNAYVSDFFVCTDFVDVDMNAVPRHVLFSRVSSS